MKNNLTLKKLKNTNLFDFLLDFFKEDAPVDRSKLEFLLKVSLILLRSSEGDLKKLAYRFLILYTRKSKDFIPLYDVAINLGYFPVVNLIDTMTAPREEGSFFSEFQSSFLETFKHNGYTSTFEQKEVRETFISGKRNNLSAVVVAPTSYGKSELIETCVSLNGSVCIIVPTKALLAQTKRRILKNLNDSNKSIVTHPEMNIPNNKNNLICILTQERLIRLLRIHIDLKFDYVFVDEAHNLLEDGDRSRLLGASIMMIMRRKPSASITYLTPFINDVQCLNLKDINISQKELRINESLKSERFFLYDIRENTDLLLYDQYFDKFLTLNQITTISVADFVNSFSALKNIVYLNKPVDAQRFALKLASTLPKIESEIIEKALVDIKKITHEEYDLLYCLSRGVIYHHGSISDNIKLYIENLYTEIKEIKYIVTTSTLLEGVNIPAEKLFVLDYRKGRAKLTPSQFKNLFGRICRFSEIFNGKEEGFAMISPEVYLVGSDEYMPKTANLKKFYKDSVQVDLKKKDNPENVLLESVSIDHNNSSIYNDFGEFINNIEKDTVIGVQSRIAETDFGRECFANNIFEIEVFQVENECQAIVNSLIAQKRRFRDVHELLEGIAQIFLNKIKEDDEDKHRTLVRLKGSGPEGLGARNFYSMLLNWRIKNTSIQEMVSMFLRYWEELILTLDEPYVYVGKWGDEARDGYLPRWIDISKKSYSEKVNLAIVRIKDEFDFLDNSIMKFIEVLNVLGLVDSGLYSLIKYGTTDELKILLIKSGMSLQLASLLNKRYLSLVSFNQELGQVSLSKSILNEMEKSKENSLVIYEASFHLK